MIRGIVFAFLPLSLTIYFIVIWRLYLVPDSGSANDLVFGRAGANAIYYSWFVLASVGLTFFVYAREGVEDRMLSQPKWSALDPKHLRDHIRVDGWLGAFKTCVLHRGQLSSREPTSLTWTLLGLITLSGFIGLPLSGLTMEFETGYQPSGSSADAHPTVVGYTKENWNARSKFGTTERAFLRWKESSRIPPPPGDGVIYTSLGIDRPNLPGDGVFTKLPNSLPRDAGVSNLFIAPQSSTGAPMDGVSWGLLFSYNCSVITKLSDFTILRHRKNSTDPSADPWGYEVLGGNGTIEIYNQTSTDARVKFANNLQAVAEIGYHWPYRQKQQTTNIPPSSECYNPISIPGGPEAKSIPYPGVEDDPQVLEIILWQNLTSSGTGSDFVNNPPALNFSLPSTIPSLLGAYTTVPRSNSTPATPMSAIGVQCVSTSSVGYATLSGQSATFSQFQPSDSTPVESATTLKCAERLSIGVPHLLFSSSRANRESEWLSAFYGSVGRFSQGYTRVGTHFIGNQVPLQSGYLQAEELRRSLTRGFGVYAMQLAYNDGVGYVDGMGGWREISEFVNGEAVGYKRDTVLVQGIVPPGVVVVFLGAWAAGAVVFGVMFYFRRWSEGKSYVRNVGT
ncbi:hypothetical protein QBC40DRAFT_223192 [Triangularia verruculosa]|uniref:Uncharacterized protein n=1 Tax=Triangularia verruculosa TaxID=2587418 RepID=A0AAN7AW41_9PEZI|nr:hypothetical protein QBC40DRAFT_223192 [Triangularia verruculosa]